MAKQVRQVVAKKDHSRQQVEHSEVFDDNMLPDAVEIERLHQMDQSIIPWLKACAEKEQDFRHKFSTERLKVTNDHDRRTHNTTRWGLAVYCFLSSLCLVGAFILIREGKNLEGSIFGGAAVILALAVLVNKKSDKPQQS